MTATAMPRRIGTLRYISASIAVRLGLEPPHEGATPEWAAELRAALTDPRPLSRLDDTPTVVIPRRPVAAIAAAPEYEVDELGPWRPQQHHLQPARLFDALTGAAR